MNLLDTHVLVWAIDDPGRLSETARGLVEDGQVIVSTASLWELLLKKHRADAPVADPATWWRRHVAGRDTMILPIGWPHLLPLDTLPAFHKDPFDRLLIAQAIKENLRLITNDQTIHQRYGAILPCIW